MDQKTKGAMCIIILLIATIGALLIYQHVKIYLSVNIISLNNIIFTLSMWIYFKITEAIINEILEL